MSAQTYVAFKNGGATDEKGWMYWLYQILGTGIATGFAANSLQGTQHAGSANMSVDIQNGFGAILSTASSYANPVWLEGGPANSAVTAAHPSLPRIDTLVMYIDESVIQNVTYNNPGALIFKVVAGTASGSPVAPNSTAIQTAISSNPYYPLANIAVGAGVTQIFTANITDLRNNFVFNGTTKITEGGSGTELVDSANQPFDLENRFVQTSVNFIEAGGCIWTPDSPTSTLNGSMTAGFVWIAGRRLSVAAITAHGFTANKDTYVDLHDAGNGTATVTYSLVNNNVASPALGNSGTTANTIRPAIIISGATALAAATTSVNQGSTAATGPTVSSNILTICDSIGNLIYPRSTQKDVAYRAVMSNSGAQATGYVVPGLSMSVIVPNGANLELSVTVPLAQSGASTNATVTATIRESGSTIISGSGQVNGANAYSNGANAFGFDIISPTPGLHIYDVAVFIGNGNLIVNALSIQKAVVTAKIV